MAYTVLIKESARRELDQLPKNERQRVEKRIVLLWVDPRPPGMRFPRGKQFQGLYRIRCGNYRVVYQVRDNELVVLVVKVGNRKDVCD